MSLGKISGVYRPIIKIVISLIVLGIINAIVVRLPGIEFYIPGLPFMIPDLVTAIIAVMMITMVLRFGYEIGLSIKSAFPTIPEATIVVSNLVYLGAIWIAYASFGGVVYPFLLRAAWVYPLIFLAFAILPAIRVARALLGSIDKWTALLHGKVMEVSGELITCPSCGKKIASSSVFCSYCGAKMAEVKPPEVKVRYCLDCGSMLEPDAKFCPKCGKEVK